VDHYFILLLCLIWGQLLIRSSFVLILFSVTAEEHFCLLCACRNTENVKHIPSPVALCSYEIWSVPQTKISVYSHTPFCFSCFYELILTLLVLTNSIEGSSVRLLCKPMLLPLDPLLCQFESLYTSIPMAKRTIMKLLVTLIVYFSVSRFRLKQNIFLSTLHSVEFRRLKIHHFMRIIPYINVINYS
jgi:hypothetical protein